MKKTQRMLSLLIMLVFSAVLLMSCTTEEGQVSQESESVKRSIGIEDSDFDDPAFANEEEGAEIEPVEKDAKSFLGSWEAPSDHAKYLYGNINLRINSDGTWTGNITEEDFEGKWKENGTGISIRDKENIINFELYYAKDGAVMLKDLEEPDIPIVLKRVSASE